MIEADLVVTGAAEVVTLAGPPPRLGKTLAEPAVIPQGALAARGDRLVFVGSAAELDRQVRLRPGGRRLEAAGGTVLPGFVDPHTHLPFAGWREGEFVARLRGDTYESIAAAGGGIRATVAATRRATLEELEALTLARLDRMLLHGTTTVEAKSGYGLTAADEIKQLEAIRRAASAHAVTVVPTFLGAHVVPQERRSDRAGYVRELTEAMIPEVARRGLARACDVFVDGGAFTPEEAETILGAARSAGLAIRVHADQRSDGGGARLAARLGALSADHLEHVDDDGIARLAAAGTVAILLPGAAHFLRDAHDPPARRMIDAGVALALATDFNPGTCPTESVAVILSLACLRYGLHPSEAIGAATINAAHALGLGGECGSLEPGKRADLQVAAVPNHLHLAYHFGVNHCRAVVKSGRVVVEDGRLTPLARGG
ncbi:MAG TPA: imidazolonepropionase [Candidatus Polarisedimenticolia bacterium]|nr:imidazolonepropionase [Candidatus Polarisedimenticolia bacterium]